MKICKSITFSSRTVCLQAYAGKVCRIVCTPYKCCAALLQAFVTQQPSTGHCPGTEDVRGTHLSSFPPRYHCPLCHCHCLCHWYCPRCSRCCCPRVTLPLPLFQSLCPLHTYCYTCFLPNSNLAQQHHLEPLAGRVTRPLSCVRVCPCLSD